MSKGEKSYRLQNDIRNLLPGQTIQGAVISRNGNTVQIALSQDLLINARIEQSISLALGQNMSFEVKTNNGAVLSWLRCMPTWQIRRRSCGLWERQDCRKLPKI